MMKLCIIRAKIKKNKIKSRMMNYNINKLHIFIKMESQLNNC